jgi:hypothetical protein
MPAANVRKGSLCPFQVWLIREYMVPVLWPERKSLNERAWKKVSCRTRCSWYDKLFLFISLHHIYFFLFFLQLNLVFDGVIESRDYSGDITNEGIVRGDYHIKVLTHNNSRSIMQKYADHHPEWGRVTVRVGVDLPLESARYVSVVMFFLFVLFTF